MALRPLDLPGPIEAVLFDLHCTLVDQGDGRTWLELAWRRAARPGTAQAALGEAGFAGLAGWADRCWEHALEVDPRSERDLSTARHREVWDALVRRQPLVAPDLAAALYETLLDTWVPYGDALPVLRDLRARGLRLGVLSNAGVDVRQVLDRSGMSPLLDAVVVSHEVGAVKPDPRIFERALELLGTGAGRTLMVGDNPHDDAGAARLGIRTLLLPRTRGPVHGLAAVVGLVEACAS